MHDDENVAQRLRGLTQPIEPGRQAADLIAMAAVRPAGRGLFASKLRLAAAFLAGLLIGSTGLAAADVLPDPAQHLAHTALGGVGVQVPDPERYHGAECGAEVKANHGAYVRDDHSLAGSDCGKKAGDGNGADDAEDGTPGQGGGPAAKGPCQGKPAWAGNKTMTPEEKAFAQAARTAECGTDAEPEDEAGAEATERSTDEATTTTTAVEAPTTTTTEATTTTTTASDETTTTSS